MDTLLSLALAAAGLGLVVFSAERLVKGVVGTSVGFGLSVFVISVVFIGFDPENLAVGAAGSYEEEAGIALGSTVGASCRLPGMAPSCSIIAGGVRDAPVLNGLAVGEADGVDGGGAELLAARVHSHELALVSPAHCGSGDNLVPFSYQVVDGHPQVGEGGPHHGEELLHPFAAACQAP